MSLRKMNNSLFPSFTILPEAWVLVSLERPHDSHPRGGSLSETTGSTSGSDITGNRANMIARPFFSRKYSFGPDLVLKGITGYKTHHAWLTAAIHPEFFEFSSERKPASSRSRTVLALNVFSSLSCCERIRNKVTFFVGMQDV